MYRDKLLRGGGGGVLGPLKRLHGARPPGSSRVIYNRKSDVFDHFGSGFNNTKFILFCSFLKISLQTTAADPEILDLDLLTGGGGGLSYGAIFSIIDGTSYSPKSGSGM